jgi:hypothetical protein
MIGRVDGILDGGASDDAGARLGLSLERGRSAVL